MDPIAALIGAGGSILGGLMNTSSQQSINAANLQQQMAIASGAQLPALVENAQKAGLNPLAVLGQSAPGGMAAVGTNPGQGVAEAGKQLAQIKDPFQVKTEQQKITQNDVEIANARIAGNNAAIDYAMKQEMFDRLKSHPDLLPGDAQQPDIWSRAQSGFNRGLDTVQNFGSTINRLLSQVPGGAFSTP